MVGSFDDFLSVLQEAAVAYSRRQHKEAIHNDNNDNGAQPSSSPLPCHSSISPSLFNTYHHHHHYSSSLPFHHDDDDDDDLIYDNTQFDDHELFLPLINSPMTNFSNHRNESESLTLQQYQGWWDDFFPTPSSPSISNTLPLSSPQQSNSSITTLTHESTLPSSNFYSTYHANEDNSISHENSSSSPPPPKDNNLNMTFMKIKSTSSDSRVITKVAAKQKQRRVKKDIAKLMIMTKSQVDVLDDGFRWRKYGQKSTKKNSTYPRSYYKCTHRGCKVRKLVERCAMDNEKVLTTYHGKHTHYP